MTTMGNTPLSSTEDYLVVQLGPVKQSHPRPDDQRWNPPECYPYGLTTDDLRKIR